MRWRGQSWAATALLVWAACEGRASRPAAPDGATPGPPPPPPPQLEPAPAGVGPAPLRRLTRLEYANSLRDLLGLDAEVGLDGDPFGPAGFEEAGVVGVPDLRALMDSAEQAAAQAVTRLPALLPCDPATAEGACVRTFVAGFGKRAFRRPLADAELIELVQLYQSFRDRPGYGVAEALRVVVAAMLQSPKFLYHLETGCPTGRPGQAIPLCPHELAARLSYFLWSSVPDPALLDSGERGGLARPEGLEREARRLLADPRARDTIGWFHRQWLDLGPLEPEGSLPITRVFKFGEMDAAEQAALLRAMDRETWEFTARVLVDGDGRLETLLSAPFSYLDERLARFYGAPPPAGPGFVRTPVEHRGGLLTQGSFLWLYAAQAASHPVKRGKVVFERVLCGALPPPPPTVPPPRPPSPTLSTRQRYAEHESNPCATACHSLIDPLGFALESFDGLGRYRAEDGRQPVDTSGVARFPLEGERAFADTAEFLRLLATSEDARRCLTRQWYRFALGRLETADEEPALERLYQSFARSDFDVRELLVGIVGTPSFRYRPPPEVAP